MTSESTSQDLLTGGADVALGDAPNSQAAPPERRPAASQTSAAEPPASAALDHATIRAIVAGIMLAMFLSALEQTIVAPALPAIGKSLGNVDDLSWIITSYLLALTATTPRPNNPARTSGKRDQMS